MVLTECYLEEYNWFICTFQTKNISHFGNMLINSTGDEKEETMTGDLCVTIHSVQGLQQVCGMPKIVLNYHPYDFSP